MTDKAPAPRIEFRWRKDPNTAEERKLMTRPSGIYTPADAWFCDYGIVLPLGNTDIRSEGEDGCIGVNPTIFYRFSTTLCQQWREPCEDQPPFRDGVHALWDSEALGGLPIWILMPNGSHAEWSKSVERAQLP